MEADEAHGVSLLLQDVSPVLDVGGRPTWRILSVAETREQTDRVRMGIGIRRRADRRKATLARRARDLAGQRSSRGEAFYNEWRSRQQS